MPAIGTPLPEVPIPTGWSRRSFTDQIGGLPVTQIASFALPADDDAMGTAAQESMRGQDVLIGVIEFTERPLNGKFFGAGDRLGIRLSDFGKYEGARSPVHARRWVSVGDRAFLVYVALGTEDATSRDVRTLSDLLGSLAV